MGHRPALASRPARSRRSAPLHLLAVLAGAVLVAACGGGAGDPPATTTTTGPESDYAAELVTAIAANQENLGLSDEQTYCIANGVVDALGGQAELEDAGVTPEQLRAATSPADLGIPIGRSELDDAAAIFDICQVDLVAVFMDGIAVDFTIGVQAEACFRSRLSQAALADLAATQLMTGIDQDVPDSLVEAALPCLELLEDPIPVEPEAPVEGAS